MEGSFSAASAVDSVASGVDSAASAVDSIASSVDSIASSVDSVASAVDSAMSVSGWGLSAFGSGLSAFGCAYLCSSITYCMLSTIGAASNSAVFSISTVPSLSTCTLTLAPFEWPDAASPRIVHFIFRKGSTGTGT